MNSNDTLDNLRLNSTFAAEALAQWQVNGTGPLGLAGGSQWGWLHVPNASDFFAAFGVADPSAGPTSAHFEMIASVCSESSPTLIQTILRCGSSGSLRLQEGCPSRRGTLLLVPHRRNLSHRS